MQLRLISFQDKNSYKDDFGDSDNEVVPDAYLERVIAEGEERDSSGGDDDSDESTDEDFNPDKEKVEDVADEYDSNVSTSDDDDGDGSDDSGRKSKKNKDKKKKKEREKSSSGSVRSVAVFLCDWIFIVNFFHLQSKSKSKKDKDDNKPKRAGTAFMMWLNETREEIKRDNPGIKVTEIAKKGI